jgi:hypothetical protein
MAVDHRRPLVDARVSRAHDIAKAFPYLDRSLIGHDTAYSAMLVFLPHGVLGLMVAGLLAAYVSDDLDASQLGHVVSRSTISIAASFAPTPTNATT